MPKISAGLLMYRKKGNETEVLLGHPGGPFWTGKDIESWSIPKGEVESGETLIEAAKREFEEETGIKPESNEFISLGEARQNSGKIVHIWAFKGDWDGFLKKQQLIEMEWPPKSGKKIKIPELDKIKFFKIDKAKKFIIKGQLEFLDRFENSLKELSY